MRPSKPQTRQVSKKLDEIPGSEVHPIGGGTGKLTCPWMIGGGRIGEWLQICSVLDPFVLQARYARMRHPQAKKSKLRIR